MVRPVTSEADPFGTAALRESVLAAWRDSPTRFREDANTEEDLRLGAYRDRMVVELAQNAADAAAAVGEPGTVRWDIVRVADRLELRVANTGALLDATGVAALASLRASAKRTGPLVGRFGVGFAAVLAVTEAPRVVSATGGVAFSAAATRRCVEGHPVIGTILAEPGREVPVLRLVWPTGADEPPVPDGFTTEVRLPLRGDVDGEALLDHIAALAPDLLLALPWLARLWIGDRRWERVDGPDGVVTLVGPDDPAGTRWLTRQRTGRFTDTQAAGLGTEARARPEWAVRWAVALDTDDRPVPVTADVLHAPTPTDERLSLPARLFATLPLEPSRRRVMPGQATDMVLAAAAAEYAELVVGIARRWRTRLVPLPGFPASDVDARLREEIATVLATTCWLPAACAVADGVQPSVPDRAPAGAVVLDVPEATLERLLADVVPGLLAEWLAQPAYASALSALGVRRLRPAELVAAVSGLSRPPGWWHELYGALAAVVDGNAAATEELGALPVPLVDGRTVTGPRGVFLPRDDLARSCVDPRALGLRVAHPDAAHPLLERLGARPAGAIDLLDAPAVREAVATSVTEVPVGADPRELADLVLGLVAASGIRPGDRPWLSALALPDAHGEPRAAGELLMPDAPLLDVLAKDAVGPEAPLAVLDEEVAESWPGGVLAAVGVRGSFTLVRDEDPVGPDHELADEAQWWAWIRGDERPPPRVVGVRDLDLIDETAWPEALRLLAGTPETAGALADPRGYCAWWLARFAVLAGHPPRRWRLPEAVELAGLYDPIPDVDLPAALLVTIGVRDSPRVSDPEEAGDLLDRLGDPARDVSVATALRGYAELADAVLAARVVPAEVPPPSRVRVLSGATSRAEDAVILDQPWLLGVCSDDEIMAAGPFEPAPPGGGAAGADRVLALADLCGVPLASEVIDATPSSVGEWLRWSDLGAVRLACALLGVDPPRGGVVIHEELTAAGEPVAWWVAADGTAHAQDSPDGLARALAWALGRWSDRWMLAGLLAEPGATTLLR